VLIAALSSEKSSEDVDAAIYLQPLKRIAMKLFKRSTQVTVLLVSVIVVASSGLPRASATPFRNLGFESAQVDTSHLEGFFLPAAEALPYWTVCDSVSGQVAYDTPSIGAVEVGLADRNDYFNLGPFMTAISGNYSVWLFNELVWTPGIDPECPAWISQTGTIPATTHWLFFTSDYGGDLLRVSLNGANVPTEVYPGQQVVEPNGQLITTYYANVSAYAGQNVTLQFSCVYTGPDPIEGNPFDGLSGAASLDSIRFSSSFTPDIPEPSTLVFLGVGAVGLLARTWTRRRLVGCTACAVANRDRA
jgi:hypothetical protein